MHNATRKSENFYYRLTQAVNAKKCKLQNLLLVKIQAIVAVLVLVYLLVSKIKLPVLGFRIEATNELVDIEQCPVLTPNLNKALKENRSELLQQSKPSPQRKLALLKADNGVFITNSALEEPTNFRAQIHIKRLRYHFPADGFVQVNAEQNQQMVNQAIDWLELEDKHISA